MKTKVSLLAISMVSLATPLVAQAQYLQPTLVQGAQQIVNAQYGKCLLPVSESPPYQYTVKTVYCGAPTWRKNWKFYGVHKNWRGYWDVFMIKDDSLGSEQCIGVEGNSGAENARVTLRPCAELTSGWDPNLPQNQGMLWLREDAIDDSDGWDIGSDTKWRNVLSQKCMDSGGNRDWVQVTQWKCAGGTWPTQNFFAQ